MRPSVWVLGGGMEEVRKGETGGRIFSLGFGGLWVSGQGLF